MPQAASRSGCEVLISSAAKALVVLFVALAPLPAMAQSPKKQPINCVCGTLDAPIRLEVFSDFQCPGCRAFYLETVMQVRKHYAPEDKVCVLYREFPLNMHAYGRKAARYSLAAQRVGKKQWLAVMDTLYAKQAQWSLDGNIEAALSGAISAEDLGRIKKYLQDPSIDKALARDIALGQKKGVTGTPSIFITALNKEQPKAPYAPYQIWKDYFDSIVK